jgi:hypothetical protein
MEGEMPIQETTVTKALTDESFSYDLVGTPPAPDAAGTGEGRVYTITITCTHSYLDPDPDDFVVEGGSEGAIAGIVIAATTDNNRSDTDGGASGDSFVFELQESREPPGELPVIIVDDPGDDDARINVDVDQPVVTLTGTVASALPGAEIVDISTALADDSVRLIGTSDALAPTDFFLI